jgi:alkylation response protein AidB-like acyl-CoA dehydrogenase
MNSEDIIGFLNGALPRKAREIDERNIADEELIKELASRGAFNALSLGPRAVYSIVKEASKWSPAVAHIIMSSSAAAFRLKQEGHVYSICITEPGGGTDIKANLKTVAEERGNEALITGEKVFASNAAYADRFLVLANGPSGPTLYLVERDPSVEVDVQDLYTFRGAGVSKVVFKGSRGVRVGTPGKGVREALETVNYERLGYGMIGLGIKEGALEEAAPKALRKVIFGKELGEFQGIRWTLADLEIKSRALDALISEAIAKAEGGLPDPYDAAMAKLLGAEVAQRATWVAVQIMGGSGFNKGSRLEWLARDARMLDIGAGAREALLDFVGDMAVKKYRGASTS